MLLPRAALVGVAPVPASSGQRVRHRLSRGGNRHANSAIHRIILLRLRHHEARTTAYVTRRQAEGLSDRDIMRCLKRHVANEIFKAITAPQPVPSRSARRSAPPPEVAGAPREFMTVPRAR